MKHFALSRLSLSLALLASGVGSAHAATISFAARIDQFFSQGAANAQLEASIPIGSTVTGMFSYDPGSQPIDGDVDDSGSYSDYPGGAFSIKAGAISAGSASHDLTVIDGAFLGWDQLVHFADTDNGVVSSGSVLPVFAISFGLYDETGTYFRNALPPSASFNVSDFTSSMFQILFANDVRNPGLGTYLASGTVTSVVFEDASEVPEPSTAALLGLGLLGFGVTRGTRGAGKRARRVKAAQSF